MAGWRPARPRSVARPQGLGHLEPDRCAPPVAVGHLVDGPAGRHPPPPGRVAEADAAGHDPPLTRRHAEDLEALLRPEEAEYGGQGTADALGPGGQLCAPDGRVDGASRRVALGETEQVQGDVLEVVGQPLGRALDLHHLDAGRVVGGGRCRGQAIGVDGLPQLGHRVAVEGTEAALHLGVVDQEEAPVLGVAPRRGADGRVEDAGLGVHGDRIGPHPAHGARRVQRFVDVHGSPWQIGRCSPGADRPYPPPRPGTPGLSCAGCPSRRGPCPAWDRPAVRGPARPGCCASPRRCRPRSSWPAPAGTPW